MGKTVITAGAAGVIIGLWCMLRALSGMSIWSNQTIPLAEQFGDFIIGLGAFGVSLVLSVKYGK